VCGRAVEQGVLLRPLGDVVVVMPPLTTTVAEIERVVEVLASSIDVVWNEDSVGAAGSIDADSIDGIDPAGQEDVRVPTVEAGP
jgi:hypothetical protein